jgi:hypothetical protein
MDPIFGLCSRGVSEMSERACSYMLTYILCMTIPMECLSYLKVVENRLTYFLEWGSVNSHLHWHLHLLESGFKWLSLTQETLNVASDTLI